MKNRRWSAGTRSVRGSGGAISQETLSDAIRPAMTQRIATQQGVSSLGIFLPYWLRWNPERIGA